MKIRLTIEKDYNRYDGPGTKPFGWIVKASNGDLPFETYSFRTRAEAVQAIKTAYSSPIWELRTCGGYTIETGTPAWMESNS